MGTKLNIDSVISERSERLRKNHQNFPGNRMCVVQDPLATDVAEQWKTNETEAIRTAKEWTLQYARE